MAHAQQPRFDIPSRPGPRSHQPSYKISREPYAVGNAEGPRGQAADFSGSSRRVLPQQNQDINEHLGGSHGYNPDWPNQDESYHGDSERYGGRGQNRGGRWPPARRPQEGPREAGGQARGYSQTRGPPSGRGRYRHQNLYHPSDHYHEPHDRRRHYQSEAMYYNDEYEHDEYSLETLDDRTPTRFCDHTPYSGDQSYQDPEWNAGYFPQDRGDAYNRKVSSGTSGYASTSRQPKAPGPRFNQDQVSSSRPQDSRYQKPSTDRIVQASIMPNTVAWDNPFPTFPLRPRPAEHANPTNLNGSTGSERVRDEPQQDNTFDNRSQTAIGGTGNYVVSPTGKDKLGRGDSRYQPDNPPSVMLEGNANSKGEGYFDAQPQSGRDAAQYQGTTQDKPRVRENGRWGPRVDQLKPISSDRHSEDNRTRPSFVFGNRMDVSYERSKTMPITLSEAALKHGHQMDQPVWQEPGFVAGYHGPEDRGFTRNSPVNGFRQGLSIQSSAHVDQPRPPQVNPVVHAQSTDTPAPHAQKDSLGDFFDTYYGASPDDHQPYLYNKDRQHRLPADEPIPHFDYPMPPLSDARRQGLAIDTHLQPQPRNQGFSPVPLHLREDVRRDHSYDPHSDSRHPRSRSQPNLEEQRSPKPPANDGFDFGVPGSPNRPTTTALVRNEHVFSADSAPTFLGTSLDQYHSDRQKRGRTPPDVYRYNDYNVPKLLAPGPGQAAMTNQGNGSNDQHHPLPTQSGRPRQMGPLSGRLSPIVNQARPISPPTMSPANPDALPSHPAPIRPGLTQIGPMNQASKPVPLRQYNLNPSTTQPSSPIKAPGPPPSVSAISESIPVTHQELERLKQATAKNPEDPKTQLLLAKKMVEAASVLIDERLDPRTRSKSREKYILDAYKIIKKLSNNGYSEATFFLADAYSRGSLGLEPDNREAFKLYQSAAKAGHAQAAYRVAVCCEIGHEEGGGTSRDAVKAMQWYKRAATLGDTPAMYKMGIISLKGLLGQPKNPKEAVIWLKRAADRADEENPHALHELALLHEKPSSNEDVSRDEAYSRQLFAEAADLGYKFSQFRLGCAYEYGLMGCPVDPRQSIAWYSKAAVQEEHQSELALSGWYLTGSEGVLQQSDTEAYLWARKAAQSGLAKAEYAMGYFTEVGIGAPASLEDAKRWYWKSASQGFEKARGRLEELKRGNPVKQKTRVSRSTMRKNSEGECTIM